MQARVFNRIKELREAAGLKQSGLARICRVGQSAVSSWETGQTNPRTEPLKAMCDYFHCTAGYILGIEDSNGNETDTPAAIDMESDAVQLTEAEKKLIKRFRSLNEDDKEAVLYRALELVKEEERAIIQQYSRSIG